MVIKGVLFDFDGTLTIPGAIDFIKIKDSMGCPPEVPILEFIESLDKDDQEKAHSLLDRYEGEAARISLPAQGAESVIRELKEKDLPLGIITRNSLKAVLLALTNFDHGHFTRGVTAGWGFLPGYYCRSCCRCQNCFDCPRYHPKDTSPP
jgi:phosphoglycolate phosphatase-like HAD superfamily hydrolase